MPTQQQTNSSSSTQPWSPQQPYLTQGFSDAASALGQANANGVAPTGFVAGMTPDQLATFNSMVGYGNSNAGVPTAETNTGTSLLPSGANGLVSAVNGLGSFNPATGNNMSAIINGANQYASGVNIPAQVQAAMQGANQEAQDITLPGINTNAAATGNVNSSGTGVAQGIVERGLAEQAGNLGAELGANAYNTGAGLASSTAQSNNQSSLAALEGLTGAGAGALAGGTGALSDAISNAGNLYNIAGAGGAGQQAAQQATFNNQNQAWNFSQSSPFQALDNYWNLVGSNNWGGTSTGNATTTSSPSMYQVIGGLLGTAGSLGQGLGSNGLGWSPFG